MVETKEYIVNVFVKKVDKEAEQEMILDAELDKDEKYII